MAKNLQTEPPVPVGNGTTRKSADLLPRYYKTSSNRKFLSATIDQLIQPGTVKKLSGYIGRQNSKSVNAEDIFLSATDKTRQDYQLEPAAVIQDQFNNLKFFKDYIDHVNHIKVFGGNVDNHERLNRQEFYSWNPHVNWDKFVNFQQYYWLPYGPDPIEIQGQQPTITSESLNSLDITLGKKSLTIGNGITFTNPRITIKHNDLNYMEGTITSYDTVSGQLIVNVDLIVGEGSYNSWQAISKGVLSTYTVSIEDQGDNYAYLLTPDGLTRNPTIQLYRGLTYIFEINSPNNPFSFKTQRVAGDLYRYDGSSLTNNATTSGQIVFEIPLNAPDILYYVSEADANTGGVINIQDIDENTFLNVDKDIIGKKTYTLANGIDLSNGMKIFFSGSTSPSLYQDGYWYVEGVGDKITLISENDLEVIGNYTEEKSLLFDDDPFDQTPFSTQTSLPKSKDYIVVNRASPDRNPWSRINRWFHQDVMVKAAEAKGQIATLDQAARATRPIIEFDAGLKLYNFGHKAKKNVDLIDTFTTDVFSTIEGSLGYNIDGIDLAQGMRVLFAADTDRFVNGKIFNVNFIDVTIPSRQIEFFAATGVDPTTDIITLNEAHGLTTGNRIIYLNEGNLSVNGLVHRNVYYVQVINDTSIKLFTNRLLTNVADIFEIGSGTHSVEIFSGIRRQINLTEAEDTDPILNETVLIKSGIKDARNFEYNGINYAITGNQGLMYWYDGTRWQLGPIKIQANQSPLFDVFDSNGYSYGDKEIYDGSTFTGTKLFSYKVGTGTVDSELGFALSYQNINNIGDIVFDFNLLLDNFRYKVATSVFTKNTDVGFLKLISNISQFEYKNGWVKNLSNNVQPVVRIFKNEVKNVVGQNGSSSSIIVNDFPIDCFRHKDQLDDLEVRVYINGIRQNKDTYTIKDGTVYKTVKLNNDAKTTDIVTLKCFTAQEKNSKGHYEIPLSLQNNPLNSNLQKFTLGEVIDHVNSIVDNINNFDGIYPGYGNLRDIGNLSAYGTRFVQHSSPLNFALYHFGSQTFNVFKAVEKARDDYGLFKRSFLTLADTIGIQTETKQFVDILLLELSKDKPKTQSYYLSDMFAYGGGKRSEHTILDTRVRVYPLYTAFNLTNLSNRSVLIYLNATQLLHGRDYTFGNDVFFTLSDKLVLAENDILEVYEYESTDGSFCPPTPSKLGIYPLYEPKKYIDDTYLTPTEVIQGHDGSITVAFGDYRDDLLLELEKRIFNNVKVSYNSDIFNIYDFIPGYNRTTKYSLEEVNNILGQFFFQWTLYINNDFTKQNNELYNQADSFTYNYRGNYYPDETDSLAFWRGIYKYTLDTDRPHTHPWECIGYSIEPSWWTEVYGAAPYTRDNYVLWDDIRQGIIRQPGSPIRYRDDLAKPILSVGYPVDENGDLISPLYANFARGLIKPNAEGYYIFGDQGPVETAWRRSSYYPFAFLQMALLLHPNKVLGTCFDRSRIVKNLDNQFVYSETNLRLRLQDLLVPSISVSEDRVLTAGLINYIVEYVTSDTLTLINEYKNDLSLLTNKIASKLGGFTSKPKYKILLDSKSPTSTSGIFVPEENYEIYLNTSSPIDKIVYSGIIVTKYADGYEVRGYNRDHPYFTYFGFRTNERTINVGGISESFVDWAPSKFYAAGKIVRYNNTYYRAKTNYTSTSNFDDNYFARLAKLPVIGGRDVIIRKNFNTDVEFTVSYGTKFADIQSLADFIQGYGAYLENKGFVFDEYNPNLKAIDNWVTSVKEFLFWTTQNWAVGSAISLSPAAKFLLFRPKNSTVDNIRNTFFGYKVYRVDGEKLEPEFTNIYRDSNEFTLSPENTNHGIYGAIFYLVQKEHILLLDNLTLFNDTIYDLEPGYRQERLKIQGYISSEWSGGFNVPGFIYDTAVVNEWTPWTDYSLGDIIIYKEFYYSASKFLPGAEIFNANDWIKLEEKPVNQLYANWDYKAEQFTDFYDLDSDNFDVEQQRLAQHLIGYQKRQYLENIINDDVSQYKFYQGMIIEKGTLNVLSKLFDVLSADNEESLTFYEEWAVRVGQYGATDIFNEIEFKIDESQFKLSPQPLELVDSIDPDLVDFVYRQVPTDVYIKPVDYNNNPWPTANSKNYLRSPGYVRYDDVKLNVDTLSEVINYDISNFVEGDYVWCAFENRDWNVYRFTRNNFKIEDVEYSSGTLSLQCNKIPDLAAGDIIGIENSDLIKGFYTIDSVVKRKIFIKTTIKDWKPFEDSSLILTFKFLTARTDTVDNMNDIIPDYVKIGELAWADNDGNNLKTVYENNKIYGQRALTRVSLSIADNNFGKKVAVALDGRTAAVTDNGQVTIFVKNSSGTNWIQKDVIVADTNISDSTNLNFGAEMCFSPDAEWLAISAPTASNIKTGFKGIYDGGSGGNPYSAGDVVKLVHKVGASGKHIYLNTHWRAVTNIVFGGDWSTIDSFSQDWTPADLIETDKTKPGNGYTNQGYVNLYQRSTESGTYTLRHSFVSPNPCPPGLTLGELALRPEYQEKFGSKLAMALDGDGYVLAVTSSGFNSEQGRVYLYRYGVTNDDSSVAWRMDYTRDYKGIFDTNLAYSVGDLVVYQDDLYECVSPPDFQNPVPSSSSAWQITSRSNIQGYFPQEVLVDKILDNYIVIPPLDDETVEMVESGDLFGYDVDFSSDGSKLIISAPAADQVVYENYKGHFRASLGYELNDVVYYQGSYYKYKLTASNFPIGGLDLSHWELLNSTRLTNTGKVFVYAYDALKGYELIQTLGSSNLNLETEDRFGESISISSSGNRIAVGSTLSDVGKTDAGRVIIFKETNNQYIIQQKLYNYKQEAFERFGSFVEFMNDDETLVVFSANGDVERVTTFDNGDLILDNGILRFIDFQVDTGRVDIFDRYNENYIFGESLDTSETNDQTDRYGCSISVGNNNIFVGARREDGSTITPVLREGKVYAYYKVPNTKSWTERYKESPAVNLSKIKKAYFYDTVKTELVSYLDCINPIQGKIAGVADQEIRYKTYYDPATYSVGTVDQTVDEGQAWTKAHVGTLWWDLTRAKFIENQVGETIYRTANWNKLYATASIDIYEWVESKYLPSEWNKLSGTVKGETLGISGLTKYSDTVYSVRKKYDKVAKAFSNLYYYWVKNPTIIPNIQDRKLSAQDVADLIADPLGEGYSCLAFTGSNTLSFVNCEQLIVDKRTNLNVEYWTVDDIYTDINSHSQWKIISDHPNTVIPRELETKWIDSLIGKDQDERLVPNQKLPIKKQFGIANRPRQSLFVNRTEALKQYIEAVNLTLSTKLIVDDYDLSDLDQAELSPSDVSGTWDMVKDTFDELRFVGTATIRQAIFTPVIEDGRIVDISIQDSGYGYVNAPFVKITGTGRNAKLKTVLNAVGQVVGVQVLETGEGYKDSTTLSIRPFAVLIANDSNTFDKWSIYEWNAAKLGWDRVRSQSFDVTAHWDYLDWYKTGYNQFTKIDFIVDNTYELARLDSAIGQTVKVQNVGSGGWLLLEKYADNVTLDYTENYTVIGRQNGTIKFLSSLYDYTNSIIGFDGDLFDSIYFDNIPVKELRIIINTIKNKILIDEYYTDYLRLFLRSVRYALNEQTFLDWAFKTSFVKATHKAGELKQKVTYRNDSLENYEDYVKEVKPYRTQIREYISSYQKLDTAASSVTDFDLPPNIAEDFSIENITVAVAENGIITSNLDLLDQYPWRHWYDNVGFAIQNITIVDGGSGYISNPVVRIVGGFGTGAEAKAYISAGRVNRIQIINNGTGYLKAPLIELDGGLGVGGVQARAVAIIESEVVRSNKISIKFDRITRNYFVTEIEETEMFTGTGSKLQFQLKFAPLTKIDTHSVKVNGVDVLKEDYALSIKTSTSKGYTSYSGLLTLTTAPAISDSIEVSYTKSYKHLSAADRINFYYDPKVGQIGKDLSQLMNGIDYGGVNITGLGFNISGGWDSQPFFTDAWDSFDTEFDDYVVTVSDSTYEFTLPYTPSAGQQINVYINGERIDDPYYANYDGSTVQANGRTVAPEGRIMQTIVGNGITNTFMLPTLESTPPLDIKDGDIVVFRKNTSDGSYTPLPEEYDTQLMGGNFAYTTATGIAPDDINVDGDGFVTPTTSHAPEEIVPGQVLDTVAIKVYQLPTSGSAKVLFKNYICDGVTTNFSLGQAPQNNAAVFVKLDNIVLVNDTDYTLDWATRSIEMTVAPADKKILNVISFGAASAQLLDTNYFVSDGSTLEYITNAPWRETDLGHIVLVDGNAEPYEIFKTDDSYLKAGVVGIRLGSSPAVDSLITYIITADSNTSASVIKTEELAADGSTVTFNLANAVGLNGPIEHGCLVMVDGEILTPSNTEYFTIKDNELTYYLSKYKNEPFVPNPAEMQVFIDGELLNYGSDYTFDLSVVSLTINTSLYQEGSVLSVYNFASAAYTISSAGGNYSITFATAPAEASRVEIVTFYNHNILDIIRTKESIQASGSLDIDTPDYYRFRSLQGGKIKLFRNVKVDDFIWVIKNNNLLSHSIDYYLDSDFTTIVLKDNLIDTDVLDIILYSSDSVTKGYGFMQFKDMLNRVHYKRLNKAKSTRLGADLNQKDNTIVVVDGSVLSNPNASKNLPGIIEINGERIEYFTKNGNVLGQIRRATLGTGAPMTHKKDTLVQDIGVTETIPYADTQLTEVVLGDGSTPSLLLDSLTVLSKHEIDVFKGGYRLKKNSFQLFEESNGYPDSPEGDTNFGSEFTVTSTNSLLLTDAPILNEKVTIVKKLGKLWTENNESLTQSDSAIAKFIKDTESNYPEYPTE